MSLELVLGGRRCTMIPRLCEEFGGEFESLEIAPLDFNLLMLLILEDSLKNAYLH
jgi:hypothetical protein